MGKNVLPAVLIVFGVAFVVTGVMVALVAIPNIVDSKVSEALVVASEDDPDYEDWLVLDEEDTPKYKRFYMFNLENPDEVMAGEKPEFKEIGPFVYRQLEEKINVEFTRGGDHVTYGWDTKYYYDEDLSNSDFDPMTTQITNINPTYQALLTGLGAQEVTIEGGSERVMIGVLTGTPLSEAPTPIEDLQTGMTELFPSQAELVTFSTVLDGHVALYTSITATYIFGADAQVDPNSFFNVDTYIGATFGTEGIANFADAAQTFSPTAMNLILGNQDETFPGWMVAVPGLYTGIMGFAGTYAALSTAGDTTAMQAAYQVDEAQLTLLAAYANNWMTTVLPALLGTDPRSAAIAQWHTGSFPASDPTDGLKAVPTWPVAWEIFPVLNALGASLTTTQATKLLSNDDAQVGSLVNTNFDLGLGLWAAAAQGNSQAASMINSEFEFDLLQFGAVSSYVFNTIQPTIFGTFINDTLPAGVNDRATMGYTQWGQGSITSDFIGVEFFAMMNSGLCPNQAKIDPLPKSLTAQQAEVVLGLRGEVLIGFMIGQVPLPGFTPDLIAAVHQYFACLILGGFAEVGATDFMFSTRSVHEWLFDYVDPLLVATGQPTQSAFFSNSSIANPPDTYNTGQSDIQKVAEFIKWQEQSEIEDVWPENEVVAGTGGTQWGPRVSSGKTLQAFVSELLRTVDLVHQTDVELYGIDLFRYRLADKLLAVDEDYYIAIQGLQDLARANGLPVYASKPHFLDVDDSILDMVDGLSPNRDDHDTYIDVEPITGAAMRVHKRLQLCVNGKPTDLVHTEFATAVYPVLWVDETGELEKDTAEDFKSAVYTAERIGIPVSLYGGVGLGGILMIAGIGRLIYLRKRGGEDADVALSNLGY